MTANEKAPTDVLCLMGATASGKTDVAVSLAKCAAVDIISVDSAMVYRGMDIGTAKPGPDILALAPHQLIDIRDPEQQYTVADFCTDAHAALARSKAAGRLPVLVGGTMLYFRALIDGLSQMPSADAAVRASIDARAAAKGWPALHRELADVDPAAAMRISQNDAQRIQRALEVYELSGRPISAWQQRKSGQSAGATGIRFHKFALAIDDRAKLHARIEQRLDAMLAAGFVGEVERLLSRSGLSPDAPSMRAVGYRQIIGFVQKRCGLREARDAAVVATRRLAKRQLTWLRNDTNIHSVNPLESDIIEQIAERVRLPVL